jgi:hypothetical protein
MYRTKIVEKIRIHIIGLKTFSENYVVYEKMWRNIAEPDGQATGEKIIWRMRFACWVTEGTDTHRVYITYCFSTATVVKRTRLNITFIQAVSVVFLSGVKLLPSIKFCLVFSFCSLLVNIVTPFLDECFEKFAFKK